MFYRSGILPLVIIAKLKHHICGRCAVLKGEVQPFQREELDPYKTKLPLLHQHTLDVWKLVMPTGSVGELPHTTDGALAKVLW